jgi:fluoride exporter
MKFDLGLAFWVTMGGGAGSLLRYVVICVCAKLPLAGIPLATLIANVAGCLAIGFLAPRLIGEDANTMRLRAGLLVGILGGFTTFSSFAYETHRLVEHESWQSGVLNIVAHNGLGLLAAALGVVIAKHF